MFPPLNENGLLPPGRHPATWLEIEREFGYTPHRGRLLRGLHAAVTSLRLAGCPTLYLDGSFITFKRIPGDYDGCWDPNGVELHRLDPILLKFENGRAAQKAKFGGELFPSTARADAAGTTFLDFFQRDRDGNPKGIVVLDLRGFKS